MVAGGEHAADGAEDYDGEDGDDDAVGKPLCQCLVLHFFVSTRISSLAYHVHALKAETTGFMIAGDAALSGVERRFARDEGRNWAVRKRYMDTMEVLLRWGELRRRC